MTMTRTSRPAAARTIPSGLSLPLSPFGIRGFVPPSPFKPPAHWRAMVDVDSIYGPSSYLRASDLPPRPVTYVIEDVEVRVFDGVQKPVGQKPARVRVPPPAPSARENDAL
ncbi:MAG: hypothetical protein ACP5LG_07780, partial [Conexivisphaera sp.]